MAFKKPAPVAPTGVNFGSLDMYVQGGGLPEGDYVMHDLTVQMYQAQTLAGVKRGEPRLGVMITFIPLSDPKEESARTQFYSMGGNADKSFAPNAETGKGIVPIPGGAGTTLNNSTNWAILLKSMYDSGLPEGIFSNDVSVLEGTHVHITNVPEPEERKGFRNTAMTGEAGAEPRQSNAVAIVTEIKDDGKPWEGTGGLPDVAPAPTPAKVAPKLAGKVQPIKKTATPPPPAEDAGDEGIQVAAISGISTVLEKNPNGVSKLLLRTGTFKAVKDSEGDDMATAVLDTFFGDDAMLNSLLGQVGYVVAGALVKPAA